MGGPYKSPRVTAIASALTALIVFSACGPGEADVVALEPIEFGAGTLSAEWVNAAGDGAMSIRLRVSDRRGERQVYEARIDNGGEPLSWDNLKPQTDRAPELFLCVNGRNQADVRVRVNTETSTVVRFEQKCAG